MRLAAVLTLVGFALTTATPSFALRQVGLEETGSARTELTAALGAKGHANDSIETLGLSTRPRLALLRMGIRTIPRLLRVPPARVQREHAVGQKTIDEIRRKLAARGFTWSEQTTHMEQDVGTLIRLLGDSDPNVRWYAAFALRDRGPDAAPAVSTLISLLEQENDPDLLLIVTHALESIGPAAGSAIPTLARLRNKHNNADIGWLLDIDSAIHSITIQYYGNPSPVPGGLEEGRVPESLLIVGDSESALNVELAESFGRAAEVKRITTTYLLPDADRILASSDRPQALVVTNVQVSGVSAEPLIRTALSHGVPTLLVSGTTPDKFPDGLRRLIGNGLLFENKIDALKPGPFKTLLQQLAALRIAPRVVAPEFPKPLRITEEQKDGVRAAIHAGHAGMEETPQSRDGFMATKDAVEQQLRAILGPAFRLEITSEVTRPEKLDPARFKMTLWPAFIRAAGIDGSVLQRIVISEWNSEQYTTPLDDGSVVIMDTSALYDDKREMILLNADGFSDRHTAYTMLIVAAVARFGTDGLELSEPEQHGLADYLVWRILQRVSPDEAPQYYEEYVSPHRLTQAAPRVINLGDHLLTQMQKAAELPIDHPVAQAVYDSIDVEQVKQAPTDLWVYLDPTLFNVPEHQLQRMGYAIEQGLGALKGVPKILITTDPQLAVTEQSKGVDVLRIVAAERSDELVGWTIGLTGLGNRHLPVEAIPTLILRGVGHKGQAIGVDATPYLTLEGKTLEAVFDRLTEIFG